MAKAKTPKSPIGNDGSADHAISFESGRQGRRGVVERRGRRATAKRGASPKIRVCACSACTPKSIGARLRLQQRETFNLVLFSQELTTLLNAGLPLIDALESLAEKESAPHARKTLSELVRLLYEGKSFSQALGQLSAVFPPLYVALVQSSEKTGAVGEALGRYVSYRQRMDEVRQKIVSASIYPMLLLVVGGGVVLFLMGYVVPRFSLVFEGLGSNLPWLSQVLMSSGMFLHAHQGEFFGGLLAIIVALAFLQRQPAFRRGWIG